MTRASDLQLLEINEGASREEINKAFKKKARVVHPDRGGTNEGFRDVFDAAERLGRNAPTDALADNSSRRDDTTSGDSDYFGEGSKPDDVCDDFSGASDYFNEGSEPKNSYDDFFGFHYDFFGSYAADMDFDDYMDGFEKQRKAAYDKWRYGNVKAGRDRRDRWVKVGPSDGRRRKGEGNCTTCSVNYGITRQSARSSGLNWTDYINHPGGLRTCWACKNSHKSVMTQNMAWKSYSRVLKSTVFASLRRERKCFRHKPVYKYSETNESTYFWVTDLEFEATREEDRSRTSVLLTSHGGCDGNFNVVCYLGDEGRIRDRGKSQTKHLLQKNDFSGVRRYDMPERKFSSKRLLESDICARHEANIDPGKILPSKRRKKNPFTQDEKQAILEGVQKFGQSWSRIRKKYEKVLSSRTAVNIKDCYRNMMNANDGSENVLRVKGRSRNPFTQDEKNAIVEGVQRFGRAWRTILREYKTVLSSRTDVNIKDCYRNLSKK